MEVLYFQFFTGNVAHKYQHDVCILNLQQNFILRFAIRKSVIFKTFNVPNLWVALKGVEKLNWNCFSKNLSEPTNWFCMRHKLLLQEPEDSWRNKYSGGETSPTGTNTNRQPDNITWTRELGSDRRGRTVAKGYSVEKNDSLQRWAQLPWKPCKQEDLAQGAKVHQVTNCL